MNSREGVVEIFWKSRHFDAPTIHSCLSFSSDKAVPVKNDGAPRLRLKPCARASAK
jgi:hypothetical protein